LRSSDEGRTVSSRPSLLSAAQQAEANGNRILGNLEGAKAPDKRATGEPRGRRIAMWTGGALAALLVLMGAAMVMGRDDAAPAANTAARETAPVAAQVAMTDATAEPVTVAAATINDEHVAPSAAAPADSKKSLSDLLSAGSERASPTDAEVLAKALETPSAKRAAKPAAKAAVAVHPKTGAPAKPHPAPVEADSDVTLLQALVAHLEGLTGRKKAAPTAQSLLQHCKQLSAAEAEQCRVRACAGGAKGDPACHAAEPLPAEQGHTTP
jgi:hypothetical protein